MKKIHVFTSAACNYIPKVRVLVESIKKWHPEWVIHLALSDEVPNGIDLSTEKFDEIHPASSLNIPDFSGWAFCHTIVELSTAIKPFMLKKLLDRDDCAGVIYLDPDTVVFSRLEEVLSALQESNLALTPHQIMPESGLAAVMDNEISSLKHGIYNLGFLAVRPTDIGKAFAAWWAERIYYFCRAEIPNGLFTDQRWIDLAPAFFEGVCILRSSRLNVAPWNITTREVSGIAPNEVTVDGYPLGFYHFTGFDSGAHRIMAQKNATGNNVVADIVKWYSETIAALSKDPLSQVSWHFGAYSDGSKISPSERLIYRERLDLQKTFPNPYDTLHGGYKAWWESQGRVEFPKLFDPSQMTAEFSRLRTILTPGYQAGISQSTLSTGILPVLFRQFLFDSAHRGRLAHRAWVILRTEGPSGLYRRMLSYS
jgi:hypothetical protein